MKNILYGLFALIFLLFLVFIGSLAVRATFDNCDQIFTYRLVAAWSEGRTVDQEVEVGNQKTKEKQLEAYWVVVE